MKDNQFNKAYLHTDELIFLCKKHSAYLQLAVTYVRKGICLNNLDQHGEDWIIKGKNILIAIEEKNLLFTVEEEVLRYNSH